MAKLTRREFLHRASFVTAGGLLAACVAPAAPAAEGDGAAAPMEEMLELRVGAIAGIVTAGLQALADRYMEENSNVSVSIDILAQEQYQQAFLLFSSDDTPDLSWYQCVPANRFNDMVTSQILVPLDDLYEQEGLVRRLSGRHRRFSAPA